MIYRKAALVCLVAAIATASARGAVNCNAARDLVVRSIEGVQGGITRTALEGGIALIEQAEDMCPGSGDAWYYNALFLTKLGEVVDKTSARKNEAERQRLTKETNQRQNLIKDANDRAQMLRSQALQDHLSPFTLAAPSEDQPLGPIRQKWALLIGISKFQHGFDSLKYTGKDASDLYQALTDPAVGRFKPDHVKLLTDSEATLTNIRAELNSIARQAGPSDLVLVFVASHGTSRVQDKVKIGQLSYILTYDTEKDRSQDRTFATALPMTDISQIVRSRVQARRTVVILDTCYSENAGAGVITPATPDEIQLSDLKAGSGRAIIAASKEKQVSNESDDLENGIFTHFLIEAIRLKGGRQALAQVFDYVSSQVPSFSAKHNFTPQNPIIFRSEHGDEIVIGADGS